MTTACLDVLREQENRLQFERFGAAEALALGNAAAELALDYDRGVSVCILRESDEMVLFQYAMDDKTPKNLYYMEGKRRAAKRSGHCSLWPWVEHELYGSWQELMDAMPEILPAGGVFPLRVQGEWTATLMISGLHDGKDHELAVRSLSRVLGVDVPEFPGKAI